MCAGRCVACCLKRSRVRKRLGIGNGWISWLSPLNGIPVYAEDTILMSLVFTYDDDCPKTSVGILECLDVDYPLETVIYGTDVPGVDVTGTLNGCTVRPCFVQFAEEA